MRRTVLLLALAAVVEARDGDFSREVLRPGTDDVRPVVGELVRVRYRATLADGTVLRAPEEPVQFVVGRRKVPPALDRTVRLVDLGSRCRFVVPGALAGAWGAPADAEVALEVELLAIPRPPLFRKADPSRTRETESGIRYEVIEEGAGEPPRPDQGVVLHYAHWGPDGVLFECTELTGRRIREARSALPFRFMPEIAGLMRPGARLRVEVDADLARKQVPEPGERPGAAVWELELVEVFDLPPRTPPDPEKATRTKGGLLFESVRAGAGESPEPGRFVSVHYTGWLDDGTVFESTHARGAPLRIALRTTPDGPLPGLYEAILRMKEGGRARITLPPGLAYGEQGLGPIPPDASLHFVLDLVAAK